ncbi:G patch domain-containing protein 8 [Megalops cyprinoides]|uniref:G patch domain-containing protein 8 n=1 Tax=Megalops cyprinoides TaxID=118141 RepID=UPI0018639FC5|nr:G patch domain-containing protein 8 [Megalops cyprinoides]
MACYYLVISSTHLSNGHFRNIKGVFRGPLCKTAGSESPDYAEKEKAIAKALEDLKANFYCELCDKQYHKHQEFDNHINSYDHAHKQRLKELKQREFARNVASKSWKDDRKQERALRRLHQLAEQRQQSECGPGSGPKFRTTTVSAKAHHQDKVPLERDRGAQHRPTPPVPGGTSKDAGSRLPRGSPVGREQPHGCKRASQSASDHSRRRAGVSFCFSRKAQLKLESSASVFSDSVEEASDREDLQQKRARRTLEALWSRTPSPGELAADSGEDEEHGDLQNGKAEGESKQKGLDACQSHAAAAQCSAEEQGCPVMALPGSLDHAHSDDEPRDSGYTPGPEADFDEPDRSSCFTSRDVVCADGKSDTTSSQLQRKGLLQQSPGCQEGIDTISDSDYVKTEECQDCSVEADEGYTFRETYIVTDVEQIKNQVSFVNVLSKDGSTTLKWPTELLLYTKSEPYVSYSCNPLYFDFKHSRNKHKSNKSTRVAGPDHCGVDSDTLEGPARRQAKTKFDIPKPKRPKHRKMRKTSHLKSGAVSELSTSSVQSVGSQTETKGSSECTQPDASRSKRASTKRSRLGKRKSSSKAEAPDKKTVAERSLKSVVNLLSTPWAKKRRRQSLDLVSLNLNGGSSPNYGRLMVKENHFRYRWDTDEYKRVNSTASFSEKSGSCSSFSDLNSDSEGGPYRYVRYSSSSGSTSRRDSGYTQTHTGRPCWSRSTGDSSSSDVACGPGKKHRDRKTHKTKRSCKDTGTLEVVRWWSPDWQCNRGERDERPGGRRSLSSCSSTSTSDLSHRSQHSAPRVAPGLRRARPKPGSLCASMCAVDHRPSRSVSRDRLRFLKPPLVQSTGTVKSTCVPAGPRRVSRKSTDTPPDADTAVRPEGSLVDSKSPAGWKVNGSPSLPLIGKFPAVRRGAKKGESSKMKCNLSREQGEATGRQAVGDSGCSPSAAGQKEKSEAAQHDEQVPCPAGEGELESSPLAFPPDTHVLSVYSAEKEIIVAACSPAGSHRQGQESSEPSFHSSVDSAVESKSPRERPLKCASPPLTEQPITFSPDEIDKYRLLQLQAQQHMQQQLQVKEAPLEVPSRSPAPAPQPGPDFQPTLLHHRALAAFSSLHPHPAHPRLTHLQPHPLHSQPHFAPLSLAPISPAVLPAHPAALLAGHPLHLAPASAFHPAPLALHPLPPVSLLPALLAPGPMAAAAAASTLHLRPLLHPLFPGQDLQPHSGPGS